MNRTITNTKIVISVLLAMLLSVLYLPLEWQAWMPPWVAMVVFYWLIFQSTSLGVFGIWLIGLLTGSLLDDPQGLVSFLLVLLAWPLLHSRRLLQFIAPSSGWLIWLLASVVFYLAKTACLLLLGSTTWSPALLRPLLSILVVSPFLYGLLELLLQLSLPRRRMN